MSRSKSSGSDTTYTAVIAIARGLRPAVSSRSADCHQVDLRLMLTSGQILW